MQCIHKIRKNVISILLFVFCCTNANAQTNLVPNPSFEQYTICPDNTHIQGILNSKPDDWYKPDDRAALYFNICQNLPPHLGIPYNSYGGKFSYQYPRTGVAYVGLAT